MHPDSTGPVPPAEEDPTTLEAALREAADTIEEALARATTAHLGLVAAQGAERTWARPGDAVTDEVRSRRTDVGLYAAGLLVEQLRAEADAAAARFPELGTSGERVLTVPRDESPTAVAAWWRGLDDGDREEVLVRHASWVGRADGLPARVRHRANLQVLDAELARRGHLLDLDPAGPTDEATVEELRDLRGLVKLKALLSDPADLDDPPEQLDQVSTPFAERFLYLLDARTYPLRTAIALGDPDGADHVVVHVPGTTTTVDLRLYRETTWMSWLRDETLRQAPPRRDGESTRVSVIDWIGYQAPYDIATRKALGDTGMKVLVPGEASDPRYAREAADRLASCLVGVRAIAPDARVVASGHSYGASAVGLALTRLAPTHPRLVQAMMTAGAPGVFAGSLHEMGLAPGTLFACVAPGDLIGMLGIFGGEVLRIPGVSQVSTTARRVVYHDRSWSLLRPPVGHEQYYHRGTTSLYAMAAVAAGDEDRVRLTAWPWGARAGQAPQVPDTDPGEDPGGSSS